MTVRWPAEPTRLVAAVVLGLSAAALGRPVWAGFALFAGQGLRMRVACLAVAVLAMVFGTQRVARFEHRALEPGAFSGVVTVTAQPGSGRALASVQGAGETVVLVSHSTPLEQGGEYRVSGDLRPIDDVVAAYYATQGAHLDLRARRAVEIGRRGGVWGVIDSVHRQALRVIDHGGGTQSSRGLVAGITLGDAAAIPFDDRDRLRASGLYHVVAASGQNVALVTMLVIVGLGLAGIVGVPSARQTARARHARC